MKKKEERYAITFYGLLTGSLNEELAKQTEKEIELYLRRHYSKGGNPAIMLNLETNKFEFVTLINKDEK